MTTQRFFNTTGKRIRILREDLRLNQKELVAVLRGRGVDVSRNHVSSVENSVSKPSLELLAALASALGTTTDYLLLLTDDPLPPPGHAAERTPDPADRAEVQRLVDAWLALDDDQRRTALARLQQLGAADKPHIIGEE